MIFAPRAKALQTTADLHLAWDVPYAPGTLSAVGVRGGEPVARVQIETTTAPAALRLSADRDHIGTGRFDVSHVKLEVLDAIPGNEAISLYRHGSPGRPEGTFDHSG